MHGLSPLPCHGARSALLAKPWPDLPIGLGPQISSRHLAAGLALDELPRLNGYRPVALRHLGEVAGADAHLLGEPSGASAFVGKPSLEVHALECNCICYRSQAAFATGAIAIVPGMEPEQLQEARRARLKQLRDEKFDGENSSLGRALGHANGAFVRQMLAGERPITEKTVAKVEQLRGCSGWFLAAAANSGAVATAAIQKDRAPPASTAGAALLAIASAMSHVDLFKRKAIASIFTDMLVSGERESAASAIDAVATVVVSLPSNLGELRTETSPIRANDDDQHHNSVETGSSTSNESITVTPAPSQVTVTQQGVDEETGKPWKESLGTPVGGTKQDLRDSKEWTTGAPRRGGRRKK